MRIVQFEQVKRNTARSHRSFSERENGYQSVAGSHGNEDHLVRKLRHGHTACGVPVGVLEEGGRRSTVAERQPLRLQSLKTVPAVVQLPCQFVLSIHGIVVYGDVLAIQVANSDNAAMRCTLIQSAEPFREHRTAWNALVERSTSRTVFLTWEWLSAWWAVYSEGRQLNIVAVWDGDSLVGAAPLYLSGGGEGELRFLSDLEVGADFIDYLVLPGKEEAVGDVIWRQLASASWRRLVLDHVPARSPLVEDVVLMRLGL